eukprot:403357631
MENQQNIPWTVYPDPEILGNTASPHILKFQYCDQCQYKKFVTGAIDKIEKEFPSAFQYNLYRDKKITGRLEVTLYLNNKFDWGDDGLPIHSKERTKQYIHDDYPVFLELLDSALNRKE